MKIKNTINWREMLFILIFAIGCVCIIMSIADMCLSTKTYTISPELQAMTDTTSYDRKWIIQALRDEEVSDTSWRDDTEMGFCTITTGRIVSLKGLEPRPIYGDLFIYEDNTTWEADMFTDWAVILGEDICAHKENPNIYYRKNGTWGKQ